MTRQILMKNLILKSTTLKKNIFSKADFEKTLHTKNQVLTQFTP